MQPLDIVICGGGAAGLSLALQARRELPELDVAVLEARERPLPEAAFKVGEATTEIGAFYLSDRLGLEKCLEENQLRKVGLRFFFQGGDGSFASRPEMGLSRPAPAPSYLIDRGRLECDLRERCAEAGVRLLEGVRVTDIELGEGDAPHRVRYRPRDAGASGSLECRWVVDALGRRRLLQRQLGLSRKPRARHAAAWFRVRGRVDVESFVAPEQRAWHERVTEVQRYHSTNHLIGEGRWIWLIPLASDCTSIGVVFSEAFHSPDLFRNQSAALAWIESNEPQLFAALRGREILDYQRLVGYSHTTRRMHSAQRWSCIGDAAAFSDPLYASGFDLIGLGNCITLDLVRKEREGALDPAEVTEQNRLLLAINEWITHSIQRAYPYIGNPHVMGAKLVWDTAAAWALLGPLMFGGLVTDLAARRRGTQVTRRFFGLTLAVQRLFAQWAALPVQRPAFQFADFLSAPSLRQLNARNLRSDRTPEEILAGQTEDMRWLEELAQVLFVIALEDTMPERLADLPDPLWLNAWGVGLQPEHWQASRLFEPESEPRDLTPLRGEIERLLRPAEA